MMKLTPRRIAILFHEKDNQSVADNYIVSLLADVWRDDGHEVFNLFGVSRFVPADLVLVHVDLSVVPREYVEFAHSYPIVLNGQVADIRKSTYSTAMVKADDRYDGPVIVKTDLNYAGLPERIRLGESLEHQISTPLQYPIYPNLDAVPANYRSMPGLLIEKFMPEMDNGSYCVRSFRFLGENGYGQRLKSNSPIVNSESETSSELIEPDHSILEWRVKLKMDYGKLDYVLVDGQCILLDANKTMGKAPRQTFRKRIKSALFGWRHRAKGLDAAAIKRMQRHRAEGLYAFFDTDRAAKFAPWARSGAAGTGGLP